MGFHEEEIEMTDKDTKRTEFVDSIHNIDCLEGMRQLKSCGVSADIIVTSPPYNVGKNNMNYRAKFKYDGENDFRSGYGRWLTECVYEMLECSSLVFLNIQMLSANKMDFLDLVAAFRGYIKDIIVWGKTNPPPAMEMGVMNSCFEFILVLSAANDPSKRKFYGCDFRGNVNNLIITAVNRNKYAHIHKAVFPEEIPEYIIKNFTKEGDTVLDPFMGLGTTAVVCKRLNRHFIGFDINEKFNELARLRVNAVPRRLDKFV
jgi:site-specific DNA-methyltransferase (adenine-specific)